MSAPDIADLRAQNTVFEDVAFSGFYRADLSSPGEPERIEGCRISANLLAVLGVAPVLGRGLDAADNRPGAQPAILLSYALWQRRFAGSPQVLGRTTTVDKTPRTVVGVMPRWFHYPDEGAQFWIPAGDAPFAANRSMHTFAALARLRPGVSIEQARAEVKTIAARLERAYPEANAGRSATAVELAEQITGGVRKPLLILLGAVALVLLVACANVANLLLSRGAQRRHELAVRTALGAPRSRLVRLLFTESLLLAALGGALGVLLALWGMRALTPLYPAVLPRASEIRIDRMALGFTALISLGSAVLAGLVPAFRTAGAGLNVRPGALRTGRSRPLLVVA
jgi:putative ABC transport system permease protein